MKNTFRAGICALLSIVAVTGRGQTANVPPPTPWSVVSRAADSEILTQTTYQASPTGQSVPIVHHVTRIASGLNYWDGAEWAPATPAFQLSADGQSVYANKVQMPVRILANLAESNSVTITSPDGIVLNSTPVAIGLYDAVSGNSLIIGEITNCSGTLFGNDQVAFTNCFNGISADVLFTLQKGSFSQDIIWEQNINPGDYDFPTNSTRIQIFTAIDGPAPEEIARPIYVETNQSVRAQMASPDFIDNTLLFGQLKFGPGHVFSTTATNKLQGAPIAKSVETINGQSYIVESIDFKDVERELQSLPSRTARLKRQGRHREEMANLSPKAGANSLKTLAIPKPGPASKATFAIKAGKGRLADAAKSKGVAADYVALPATEPDPMVFQGDETYFVDGPADFDSVVLEKGTCVKYPNVPASYVEVDGNLICNTGPYLPAIFTSADDDSVGQSMSGVWTNYSGAIQPGGYANPALEITGNPTALSNLRVSDAVTGIYSEYDVTVTNLQVINCGYGFYTFDEYGSSFENVLVANVNCAFGAYYGSSGVAENTTVVNCNLLAGDDEGWSLAFIFYNSILANVTSLVSDPTIDYVIGNNNGFYNCDNSGPGGVDFYGTTTNKWPFWSIGGGSYYLTNGCVFRGAGITNNIDPALLADLAQRTTYPPIVFSNFVFTAGTNFGPRAIRENTNAPDIGFAYPTLDYVFGGCDLYSNLTFTAGTAVGWFENNGGAKSQDEPYAISLCGGAELSFDGSATLPCIFARYPMVQEGEGTNWTGSGSMAGILIVTGSPPAQLFADFTKVTSDSWTGNIIRDYTPDYDPFDDGQCEFLNCEFYDFGISAFDMASLAFTNCLFFRFNQSLWGDVTFSNSPSLTYENCTFYNGGIFLARFSSSTPSWLLENCAFDGTDIAWSDVYNGTNYTTVGYNAYNTNNFNWINYPYYSSTNHDTNEVVGPNDRMVTNFNWETSWFGNFYQPTSNPTFHAGSTNAGAVGLYWFTTRTNQTINGTNQVTIGYSYVATDTNGNPINMCGGTPYYISYPDGPPPLEIITNPVSLTVTQGSNASFGVTAQGFPSLSYQWYLGGMRLSDEGDISGSASPVLHLGAVQPDQAGSYYVVVTDDSGSVASSNAALDVVPSQTYDTYPLYVMPPYAYWNVTDISDPAQPAHIGELQAPYSKPNYNSYSGSGVPTNNALWHTSETISPITEAYGTAASGGAFGKGTVFKIGLMGLPEGEYPNELTLYGSTFYGTTAGYGENILNATNGYGTIFSVNTSGSGFTNLFVFNPALGLTHGQEGVQPNAGLVVSGNMAYGTTPSGGDNGDGTVFGFNLTNGVLDNLYQFQGQNISDNRYDGAAPDAKLAINGSTLYGTTSDGGSNYGTVFQINTDMSGYQILYDFLGGHKSDGADPEAALLFSGGVLYGTTMEGGAYGFPGYGTVFSIDLNSNNNYTVLHSFNDGDGADPVGGLMISNGMLYGTTLSGGTNGGGTVFSINLNNTNAFKVLHHFNQFNTNDAAGPGATLLIAGNVLYGTANNGGNTALAEAPGYGAIFSIDLNNNDYYTNLYSFQNGADGAYPGTALVLSNNILFGVTDGNADLAGDPNYGTIFSINTNGTGFTVINALTTSSYKVLHNFGSLPNADDGAFPRSQLAMSGSDFWSIPTTLYGTTLSGGTNGYGTVFKMNTDGSGFTSLYDFTGWGDGKFPRNGLLIDGNTLYGTTSNSIFKINTDGNDFTCLTNNLVGASQLILSLSGDTLYGTISNGGYGYGSVFGIHTDGSRFTNVWSFQGGTNGEYPDSGLECQRAVKPSQSRAELN